VQVSVTPTNYGSKNNERITNDNSSFGTYHWLFIFMRGHCYCCFCSIVSHSGAKIMLFNLNVLPLAPLIKPFEKSKSLNSLAKQQGSMITGFNKMLGCHRPDAAKVKYDAEKRGES
jgi:hypothetical protein